MLSTIVDMYDTDMDKLSTGETPAGTGSGGPLAGVRIVDMTTVLMGPYACQILGDYGADVIKVEAPVGDLVRQIAPARHPGMGALFLNTNRSKRSIVVDLKTPEGREVLLRLCRDADVLVYNVRAKSMKGLGLSYEEVSAVNPRIVYAGLFGFGQDGPYAAKPAYDDLIQGGAVIPYLYSRAGGGEPRYVPAAIADRIVGLNAVGAILATLVERDRSGRGQAVEIPMFETMVNMLMGDHLGGLTFTPPLGEGGYPRHLSPDRKPYRTSDGYVCALIYTDAHWERFASAIGRPELLETDPRFRRFADRMANINAVYAFLSELFLSRSTAEWIELLETADIPVMPMHDFQSVVEDPHLKATGYFAEREHPTEGPIRSMKVPAHWSRTDPDPRQLAPMLGEHSAEILAEAGFDEAEIAELVGKGAVRQFDPVAGEAAE